MLVVSISCLFRVVFIIIELPPTVPFFDCSQITQLLTDVIYFVAYKENTGGDPFAVQMTHSDRERSKLLREQSVLKQVQD